MTPAFIANYDEVEENLLTDDICNTNQCYRN